MPALTPHNDEIRSQNVAASECGTLLDSHPYATPEGIWDRLYGYPVDRVASEAMETGSWMEPAIAALAAKRLNLRIRANRKTYVHPRVRLCATPDYLVTGQPPGLLEIKMSGRPEIWPMRGPLPPHVEWQVRAQMACTGRQTAAVCVLVGVGLRTFILERDREQEDRLLAAVDDFWTRYVVTGIRPTPAPPEELILDFIAG